MTKQDKTPHALIATERLITRLLEQGYNVEIYNNALNDYLLLNDARDRYVGLKAMLTLQLITDRFVFGKLRLNNGASGEIGLNFSRGFNVVQKFPIELTTFVEDFLNEQCKEYATRKILNNSLNNLK